MPELPGMFGFASSCTDETEVERARKLIHESCKGYKIAKIDTFEDKIVYCGGTDHEGFVGKILLGMTSNVAGQRA